MSQESAVRTGKRAATQHNHADRSNSLFIGDAHVAALRFLLDGHFGNNGDAHASADHAEKAAELAAFKNDLRMETRSVTGSNGGVAETVTIAQEQERFGAEILEGKRLARVEFVFFGERCEEPLRQ
jgi:hypothetical protein